MSAPELDQNGLKAACLAVRDCDALPLHNPTYAEVAEAAIRAYLAATQPITPAWTLKQISREVNEVVNMECTCGGGGPDDPHTCPACKVWHRLSRSMGLL